VSTAALAVAGRNAAALGVADRLELVQSDWCAAVTGRFDLIVSNPPYIAPFEMADLSPEVRDHEPHLALTDGKDGLECYRIIAQQAPAYLADGGRFMVEIGPTQAQPVCTFFDQAGLIDVAVVRDFDGRDRVVTARVAPR
jgi:release factor glutamine methyltransferase